ncbi:hypothetical protein HS088_TW12G00640 [Tripterygium wilfordii]|uniref:BHLH domain-containing protein n=1 Tax=Tripterygium wilfordii TaxID=458696 RepID=A0A7J7CZB7_TRIWF|nr:hypothetical protein HS088_TW12G00640 [Tripterygium wilfordii]
MALEAVVFQQDWFTHNSNQDLYNFLENNWSNHITGLENEEDEEEKASSYDFLDNQTDNWNSSISDFNNLQLSNNNAASDFNTPSGDTSTDIMTTDTIRPKRRRSKSRKNKQEIENQRMTHIAVERNRRKQMNEYLSVIRSLMPESYAQRGDQASIIGGAINYVKELEQRIRLIDVHKEIKAAKSAATAADDDSANNSQTFSEFFTFPQYSKSNVADIEVTMVETHAHVKIRSKRRPKLLLKLVSGLQTLCLTVLHLNVTTAQQIVLYSVSVKVEDECKLTSVDEIATAVYELLGRIQANVVC